MKDFDKYFEKNARFYGSYYGILCPNGKQITNDSPRLLRVEFDSNLGLGGPLKPSDVSSVKMSVNPPDSVRACGGRVIDTDGKIREWVGIGWIDLGAATEEDFHNIPHLVKE